MFTARKHPRSHLRAGVTDLSTARLPLPGTNWQGSHPGLPWACSANREGWEGRILVKRQMGTGPRAQTPPPAACPVLLACGSNAPFQLGAQAVSADQHRGELPGHPRPRAAPHRAPGEQGSARAVTRGSEEGPQADPGIIGSG
ncbi:hypothetical protein NDU88_001685 [Pleurodeles waltl]|uniref:Uncharacterized protein n=1 Tax=Pleurodeles waltl TaxID=8319 RepID=A0AAV7R8Q0_PLEWA|nr:hypothetical protein NDU88_001685 [Pleurodeles waltl]